MAGPGPVLMELREACSESSSHQTVLSPTIAPGRQNTLEQASHSPLRAQPSPLTWLHLPIPEQPGTGTPGPLRTP